MFEVLSGDNKGFGWEAPQVKYFISYLDEMKCRSLLVERKYVDKDFIDDYTKFYAKCFKEYPKYCDRIHFFKQFDFDEVRRYLRAPKSKAEHSKLVKNLDDAYIGFTVVRPLPWSVVGRTVLKTYDDTIHEGEDRAGSRSIRCI